MTSKAFSSFKKGTLGKQAARGFWGIACSAELCSVSDLAFAGSAYLLATYSKLRSLTDAHLSIETGQENSTEARVSVGCVRVQAGTISSVSRLLEQGGGGRGWRFKWIC